MYSTHLPPTTCHILPSLHNLSISADDMAPTEHDRPQNRCHRRSLTRKMAWEKPAKGCVGSLSTSVADLRYQRSTIPQGLRPCRSRKNTSIHSPFSSTRSAVCPQKHPSGLDLLGSIFRHLIPSTVLVGCTSGSSPACTLLLVWERS